MKSEDLNKIISVVSGFATYIGKDGKVYQQKIEPTICIAFQYSRTSNFLITYVYPCVIGSKNITSEGSYWYNMKDMIDIRPATAEEIKEWKHADGLLKNSRSRLSSMDKVKALKSVKDALESGDILITSL